MSKITLILEWLKLWWAGPPFKTGQCICDYRVGPDYPMRWIGYVTKLKLRLATVRQPGYIPSDPYWYWRLNYSDEIGGEYRGSGPCDGYQIENGVFDP